MYRYFLDNTLIDEPEGWDELVTTIKRDASVKGLLKLRDVTLSFKGSGYTYLKAVIDTTGHCAEVSIRIEELINGVWAYDFEGKIFVSDIEWYEFKHECKTKVTDNSYNARIYNNRDIGIVLTSEVSKNSVPITPITACELTVYHNDTGVDYAEPVWCFRLRDAFDLVVRAISDDDVHFTTDYFGASGSFPDIVITTGYAVRRSQVPILIDELVRNMPPISLKFLFEGIDKQFNARFSIDESVSPPVMRLENEAYYRTLTQVVSLDDISEVVTKTAVDRLFARVKFGSAEVANFASLEFPESIRFIGFNKEEYYVLGQCNIDTELNLQNPFITSSNVIEYCLENASDTSYDKEWIMITATSTGTDTFAATKTNWIGVTSDYYYNEALTNTSVANRYLGGVPNSIAVSLTTQDDSFQAASSVGSMLAVATTTYVPYPMDLEIADTGGNYNVSNYHYTAPQNGVYGFSISLPVFFINLYPQNQTPIGSGDIYAYLDVYDSFGYGVNPVLYSVTLFSQSINSPHGLPYMVNVSNTLNLNTGETVVLRVTLQGFDATALGVGTGLSVNALATFACTASSTGGGTYQTYNPEDYPVFTHEFKYPLTKAEFNSIATDPKGLINFRVNAEQYKQGWIDNLKYNHKDGLATIKLISSKTLNQ